MRQLFGLVGICYSGSYSRRGLLPTYHGLEDNHDDHKRVNPCMTACYFLEAIAFTLTGFVRQWIMGHEPRWMRSLVPHEHEETEWTVQSAPGG